MARLFHSREEAESRHLYASEHAPPPPNYPLWRIQLSIEARRRYHERFFAPLPTHHGSAGQRPVSEDELKESSAELRERMEGDGRIELTPPPWVGLRRNRGGRRTNERAAYLVIDDEVVLPLVWDHHHKGTLRATTCLWSPRAEPEPAAEHNTASHSDEHAGPDPQHFLLAHTLHTVADQLRRPAPLLLAPANASQPLSFAGLEAAIAALCGRQAHFTIGDPLPAGAHITLSGWVDELRTESIQEQPLVAGDRLLNVSVGRARVRISRRYLTRASRSAGGLITIEQAGSRILVRTVA
jgi:hypothetical protein